VVGTTEVAAVAQVAEHTSAEVEEVLEFLAEVVEALGRYCWEFDYLDLA